MRESVHYHNVADVEVGSFMSSGIDSSYMAALLAQENPLVQTFTVGFSEYEGERDEISWAAELAEKLDVSNTNKYITQDEYWKALPYVQWHMDEPSGDPSAVALFFVDQIASKKVKAVLSGEGAGIFGLHHPRPQAQRERSLPHGRGGHLDHARRPGHARAGGGGAQGGRLRHPLRVHPRAVRQRGVRAVRCCTGRDGGHTRKRPGRHQNGKTRIWKSHIWRIGTYKSLMQ